MVSSRPCLAMPRVVWTSPKGLRSDPTFKAHLSDLIHASRPITRAVQLCNAVLDLKASVRGPDAWNIYLNLR